MRQLHITAVRIGIISCLRWNIIIKTNGDRNARTLAEHQIHSTESKRTNTKDFPWHIKIQPTPLTTEIVAPCTATAAHTRPRSSAYTCVFRSCVAYAARRVKALHYYNRRRKDSGPDVPNVVGNDRPMFIALIEINVAFYRRHFPFACRRSKSLREWQQILQFISIRPTIECIDWEQFVWRSELPETGEEYFFRGRHLIRRQRKSHIREALVVWPRQYSVLFTSSSRQKKYERKLFKSEPEKCRILPRRETIAQASCPA